MGGLSLLPLSLVLEAAARDIGLTHWHRARKAEHAIHAACDHVLAPDFKEDRAGRRLREAFNARRARRAKEIADA